MSQWMQTQGPAELRWGFSQGGQRYMADFPTHDAGTLCRRQDYHGPTNDAAHGNQEPVQKE